MTASSTPWSGRPEARSAEQLEAEPTPTTPDAEQPDFPQPWGFLHVGLLIGIAVVTILLVVMFQSMFSTRPTGPKSPAAPATTSSAPAVEAPKAQAGPAASGPRSGNGVTFGKVVTTDGSTLQINGISGVNTIVHTDERTRVHVLLGSRVADVRQGAVVMAYGQRERDGSITANRIIGISIR
ncbi:hypothetical protein [Nocardia wallacei]|uniref:hypothetical protein n=1 Tax=Nocardia wallacei TaxID=480035 RepID=UPI002453D058|nr:hypothetical protein [Nocardia wallacei]